MSAVWITTVIVALIFATAVGVCVITFNKLGNSRQNGYNERRPVFITSAATNTVWSTKLASVSATDTTVHHPDNPQTSPSTATSTTSSSTTTTTTSSSPTTTSTTPPPQTPKRTRKKRRHRSRSRCGHLPGDSRSRRHKRVVNGVDANRGQYPWVVMVLVQGSFVCGGSILGGRHVLTAAHCVRPIFIPRSSDKTDLSSSFYNASDVEVIAGKHTYVINSSHHDVTKEQRVAVRRVIPHHRYDDTDVAKYNDLAILELQTALVRTDRVSPICLPRPNKQRSGPPRRASFVGWGSVRARYRLNWTPTPPKALQQLGMTVWVKARCRRQFSSSFPHVKYMSSRQICAVSLRPGISSTCNGDSGGPLFTKDKRGRYVQWGVLSWGYCVARPSVPTFFTYLPRFLPWIEKVTTGRRRPREKSSKI
ncbi:serine protease 33-like [Babylonia areolata]|uniref:serine protease 33-like n=1 Tax=Babylonia areolata TaxID=304850 RepID=UPI003FCFE7B5